MLQHLTVLLVLRGPKLNTVLEVQPHQCQVQGHDHLRTPPDHTVPDTSQDAVGLLGHLGTLLAHVQLVVDQHPKVLLRWAAFLPLLPKPAALHGVVVTKVQDLALRLVESQMPKQMSFEKIVFLDDGGFASDLNPWSSCHGYTEILG